MFYYTPYIILPLLSVCVSGALAVYSLYRRQVPAARPLFWLMLGMSGWALSYALNTAATSLPLKIFFLKSGVAFVCLVVPSMLALSLETVGLGAWLTRRRLMLICAIPAISVALLVTSGLHSLQVFNFSLVASDDLLLLTYDTGTFFLIHATYARVMALAATAVFASGFWRMPRSEWSRYALLVIATVTPLAVNILSPRMGTSFNFSTSTLFLSSLCYAQAVFRHRMLDLMPLARMTLFDQIGEPVLVFSDTGKLVDCNHAARTMLTDVVAAKIPAIQNAMQERFPSLSTGMDQGLAFHREEYHPDALEPERYWRVTASKLDAGAIGGTLLLLHDISDLKHTEQKLLESEQHLQDRVEEEASRRLAHERLLARQSRLAAMGEMIGVIAHQWRQPLATLGMIVQRVHAAGTMQKLTPESLDEFKANAMRQIIYMSDTIEEFRGFYRPEKQKQLFCPFSCIFDCVRLFETQLSGSNIVTEFCCPHRTVRSLTLASSTNHDSDGPSDLLDHECNCGSVYGVPNEFKQVVLNLLSNARDAILAKRSANKGPEEGSIGVSIYSGKKNTVIIDFSDNGCGIPADAAPRIFDPYFTTKEESGGTGIGLYMSRMIVEDSLGGRLRLVKGKGGTLFRIELPQKEIA